MTAGSVAVPIIIPLKAPGSNTSGVRKWIIDSETPIELQTDTKDALLFYSLNGSKPDPFRKLGEKTTYHYTRPIKLKPGKITIKAIAVLKDGSKESSVNTKVFQVNLVDQISDEESSSNLNSTWERTTNEKNNLSTKIERQMFKKVIHNEDDEKPSLNSNTVIKKVMTDSPPLKYVDRSRYNPDRAEDAMHCLNCNVQRPLDPYARFCPGCSLALPPAPGKIRSQLFSVSPSSYPCENCHSMLPLDAMFCSACETSVRYKHREKYFNSCPNCGSNNQRSNSDCVVCERKISCSKPSRSDAPHPSEEFMICPMCTRINSANARFCDWCGNRSSSPTKTVSCQRCFTENLLDSQYCCSCGKVINPPSRKEFDDTLQNKGVAVKTDSGTTSELINNVKEGDNFWKKVPFEPIVKRQSKNVAVQVGDELPGSMSRASLRNASKLSPGKGYWRQQVEHIVNHLKIYTQNSIQFRESLSNHIISGLISADVKENIEGSELTITSTFGVCNKKATTKIMKNSLSGQTLLNALAASSKTKTMSSRPSSGNSQPNSARSRPSSGRSRNGSRPGSAQKKKKVTHKSIEKERIAAKLSKLSEDSLELLNIIKSTKRVDTEKVQHLLDSGNVDINLKNENGLPLLKLCVLNKHFDILEAILLSGSDIDEKSDMKETTALHEAVMMGMQGKEAIEILLQNGASPDVKDKKDRTAYDIALESGSDIIITKFTKQTTTDFLKDVIKL